MASKKSPSNAPLAPRGGLTHNKYSQLAVNSSDAFYQGRKLIDSHSEKVQGGVVCPLKLRGTMEAITVDYEVDLPLKSYIVEMEQHLMKLYKEFKKNGRTLDLAVAFSIISHKIAADFPYSRRMMEGDYARKTYTPGVKYRLSNFMINQNMVCRHMALLAAAILDHLKENARAGKMPSLKADTEVRYMADSQRDSIENRNSGHAYVIVKRSDDSEKKNLYYVIDPTGGTAVEIRNLFTNRKREISTGAWRYLFSVLRVVFQKEDNRDEQFLNNIFSGTKSDVNLLEVLKDLKKSLTDVNAIRRFQKHAVRASLQGVL